jgi:hypothetical protein
MHEECCETRVSQGCATASHEVAYFSGLGMAVPTVFCGVTPALERA